MSQDKPNMDEVIRQVKEYLDNFYDADDIRTVWLRLLIEERERDKAENERLNRRLKWMEQIDMDRQADFELHAKSLRNLAGRSEDVL